MKLGRKVWSSAFVRLEPETFSFWVYRAISLGHSLPESVTEIIDHRIPRFFSWKYL